METTMNGGAEIPAEVTTPDPFAEVQIDSTPRDPEKPPVDAGDPTDKLSAAPRSTKKSGLRAKMQKAKKKKSSAAKAVNGTKTTKARSNMAGRSKSTEGSSNGEDKVGISLTTEAAKALRQMRAKVELESGEKTSNSDAILQARKVMFAE